MTEEAKELHRIISASVRDMLTEYRLQARPGPIYPDPTNVINSDRPAAAHRNQCLRYSP